MWIEFADRCKDGHQTKIAVTTLLQNVFEAYDTLMFWDTLGSE